MGHWYACPSTLVEFLQICVLLGYCTTLAFVSVDLARLMPRDLEGGPKFDLWTDRVSSGLCRLWGLWMISSRYSLSSRPVWSVPAGE